MRGARTGSVGLGSYLRAVGQVYGSSAANRKAGEAHDAVTGTSRGADAGCLYNLDTQHDPRRASALAWRTCRDDNGLLGALQPVNLLFEFGYPLLALGHGARRIRDPINLGHQPFDQHLRIAKRRAGAPSTNRGQRRIDVLELVRIFEALKDNPCRVFADILRCVITASEVPPVGECNLGCIPQTDELYLLSARSLIIG